MTRGPKRNRLRYAHSSEDLAPAAGSDRTGCRIAEKHHTYSGFPGLYPPDCPCSESGFPFPHRHESHLLTFPEGGARCYPLKIKREGSSCFHPPQRKVAPGAGAHWLRNRLPSPETSRRLVR